MGARRYWRAPRCAVLAVLVVIGLTGAGTGYSEELPTVTKAPPPKWVIDRPIPKKLSDRVAEGRGGLAMLLQDRQIRWNDDSYLVYDRAAFKITNRSALEGASRVVETFDPSREEVTLNQVHIIRDGKVIDQLKDLDISVIRRESDLESGVWTGHLTAVAELKDVRVGDIIDIATTDEVHDKLYPRQIADTLQARFVGPVGERHYRLIWPKDRSLKTRSVNTDLHLNKQRDGKFEVYSLDQTDPDPMDPESSTPAWYPYTGFLAISSAKSWKQVVEWAMPLMYIDLSLPDDFAAKIDEIAKKWPKPEDRITETLRLVQDSIRYVSIAIGNGAIIPRPPKQVIKDGYGDCKDKGMLLIAALRRLKIKAVPVLANLLQGRMLDQVLPSPNVFNHMIVLVEMNGHPYWLDATRSSQGGRFPNLSVFDYGFVLPLRHGQSALEEVVVPDLTVPETRTEMSIKLSKQGDVGLALTNRSDMYGNTADAVRAILTASSKSDMAKGLERVLAVYYPGIKGTGSVDITDDRDADHISITGDYTMDRDAFNRAGYQKSFDLNMTGLIGALDAFPPVTSQKRKAPLGLPKSFIEQVFHVTTKGQHIRAPEEFDKRMGPVHFRRTVEAENDHVTITDRFQISAISVPAKDAKPILALAHDLEGKEVLTFNMSAGKPADKQQTATDITAAFYHVKPEELAPYTEKFNQFIQIGAGSGGRDMDALRKSLPIITGLTKEVKRPSEVAGLFDSLRGALLYQLGRYQEARDALEAGYKHYKGSGFPLLVLATLRAGKGDYYDSALLVTDIATRFPKSARQITGPMAGYLLDRLELDTADDVSWHTMQDMASALVTANYQLDPLSNVGEQILPIGIQRLTEQGKLDLARANLPKLTSPTGLLELMVDNRYKALWPDVEQQAGPDLGRALDTGVTSAKARFEDDPTNLATLTTYLTRARLAGTPDAALTAVKSAVSGDDSIDQSDNNVFPLLSDYALTLHRTGAVKETAKALDLLSDDSPARNYRIANFRLDKAQILLEDGQLDDVLSLLDKIKSDSKYGWSNYHEMRLTALRACAYSELGRADDENNDWTAMRYSAKDDPDAYIFALACADRLNDLAKALIKALDDPATRAATLLRFQHYKDTPPLLGLREKMHVRLMTVESRPDVQAKLHEVGRVIDVRGSLGQWQDF